MNEQVNEHAERFSEISWQQVSDQAKQKLIDNGEKRVRMLELSSGFREQDWCKRGHTGYIVSGTLHVEFENGPLQSFGQGEPLLISPGELHKARVESGTVRLFLVDDV